MKLVRTIFAIGLLVLSVMPAIAQYRSASPTGDTQQYLRGYPVASGLNLRGILDPARMHISNSLAMGYYNGGGSSGSQGLYLNQIDYQISPPLSVTTHFGYRFQPTGSQEWNATNSGSNLVGGMDLNWQPSQHTNFRFSVYRGLQPEYPYAGYGWGYEPWRPYGIRP